MSKRFTLIMLASLISGCGLLGAPGPADDPFSVFIYHKKIVEYPYGARWVKEGMTRESRLTDWVACGGGRDLRDGFRVNAYGEPMRQYLAELEKHRYGISICMTSKKYQYFDKDYEYEHPKVTGTSQRCDVRCLYP